MKTFCSIYFYVLLCFSITSQAQQLDVTGGANVKGMVYTQTGVKFPDQSIQTTAADSPAYQNALAKGQPFMTITTANPAITDVIQVVEITNGGISGYGSITANEFVLKINLENSSPYILQKLVIGNVLTKVTISFPEQGGTTVYKTVELRNVVIRKMNYSTAFLGNNNYAHLMELNLAFTQMEIRTFNGSGLCYCWSINTNAICNCD